MVDHQSSEKGLIKQAVMPNRRGRGGRGRLQHDSFNLPQPHQKISTMEREVDANPPIDHDPQLQVGNQMQVPHDHVIRPKINIVGRS